MILNLNVGYSQDTTIELEYDIARLVIEDLIKGDASKEELFLSKDQIKVLESKISLKDSIILKKNDIIGNYESIMGKQTEQLSSIKDLSKQLQLDLKKQKAKTQLFKLGGTAVLIGAVILTIL
jgi:hypothetical protein